MTDAAGKRGQGGPTRGLVLSGGGARGAYEVGVLDYVFSELPKQLVSNSKIQVLSGTSVGAVHASYLAATAHLPQHNIGRLVQKWKSLRLDKMLRLDVFDALRLPFDVRSLFRHSKEPPSGVVIHSGNLRSLVVQETPWGGIRDNLRRGLIDALTVTTTHIASGKTVVFVDTHDGGVPPWTRDRRVLARAVKIGPSHALASAAIPFLFPAVRIDGGYYSDGGLRQNTPLSPALRLGCDRVMVVGLRHEGENASERVLGPNQEEPYPGPFMMIGKILDALLLDHLDYDLARLEGFNALLRDGQKVFGDSFVTELNGIAQRTRGVRYKQVDTTLIRPSRDIGEMANEFVFSHRGKLGPMRSFVLERIARADFATRSDFLSYLMFDGRFAEMLIALGRADADANRERLITFLKD